MKMSKTVLPLVVGMLLCLWVASAFAQQGQDIEAPDWATACQRASDSIFEDAYPVWKGGWVKIEKMTIDKSLSDRRAVYFHYYLRLYQLLSTFYCFRGEFLPLPDGYADFTVQQYRQAINNVLKDMPDWLSSCNAPWVATVDLQTYPLVNLVTWPKFIGIESPGLQKLVYLSFYEWVKALSCINDVSPPARVSVHDIDHAELAAALEQLRGVELALRHHGKGLTKP